MKTHEYLARQRLKLCRRRGRRWNLREAMTLVEKLRTLHSPFRPQPRIELEETA